MVVLVLSVVLLTDISSPLRCRSCCITKLLLASTGVSVSLEGMDGSCSMDVGDVSLMSYVVYGVFGCLDASPPHGCERFQR